MILEKDENGFFISKCKDCIFGDFYQDQPWHKEQVGCKLNRIDKFKERGTLVEFKEGDAVDSYEIHTFCNAIRDQEWLDEHKFSNLEDAKEQVSKDNELKYTCVIYSEEGDCIEKVRTSLNSVLKQDISPEKIIIAIHSDTLDYPKLITEIRSTYISNVPLSFSRVLEYRYPRYLIDFSLLNIKSTYYLAVLAGSILEDGLVSKVNNMIEDCKMVSIAKNLDSSILLVSKRLHDELGGNSMGILTKDETESKYFNIEDKLVAINNEYSKTVVEL